MESFNIAQGVNAGLDGNVALQVLSVPVESPSKQSTVPAAKLVTPNWIDQAIRAFDASRNRQEAGLRARLIGEIRALTGRPISSDDVFVDPETRTAYAVVDGVRFRLRHDELVLLRPCAYCGTGEFASDPVNTKADLGHALNAWQPLHRDCQWDDPE